MGKSDEERKNLATVITGGHRVVARFLARFTGFVTILSIITAINAAIGRL